MAFLDCSLALGMVAAEARGSIAAQQAAGALPWIGVNDSAKEQRQQADHAATKAPAKQPCACDPRHALQKKRRLAGPLVRG